MLISKDWLNEWVNSNLDAERLGQRFTSVGLELAAIEPAGPVLSKKIISGRIESVEPHPRADRLQVCRVYVGRKRLLQIVCGAKNARSGLAVAVALIGAKLPTGLLISKSRIREVVSSGMLCSAAELGLEDKSSGILELDKGTSAGQYVGDILKLDDEVIEVDLTPNRGDCLSLCGVAREVSAFTGTRLKGPAITTASAQIHDKPDIHLQAGAACPRYIGRIIKGVEVAAQTPLWMTERLRRSGVRPVSAIVDVTNYVMLELGQPMHAFDLDALSGNMVVRLAAQDEALELLDGSHLLLDADVLVIANDNKPVAMAGIMGGQRTAISDNTSNILLEAAFFAPEVIAGKARRYGLQTDSSFRFERGVDPELPARAMQRATQLIMAIAGGHCGPLTEAVIKATLPQRPGINLRRRKLYRVLGCELPDEQVQNSLRGLGLRVRKLSSGWRVTAPSFRFDIACEEDLIEEVARSYGYERIAINPPRGGGYPENHSESVQRIGRIDDLMMDLGYQEAITYSFVEAKIQQQVNPECQAIALLNPIAANMDVMRSSLWPGLLTALANNLNRQHDRVRLFEKGRCFQPLAGSTLANETESLAAVACGSLLPKHWKEETRGLDFFDIKGDIESLLMLTGDTEAFEFSVSGHPALHPGRSARLLHAGQTVGYLGQLHPAVQQALDIDETVYLFELKLSCITTASLPQYQSFSRFPETRRDLAIVVSQDITASRMLKVARTAAGPLLKKLELFDDYRGKNIPMNKKSLAFGLTLQHSSRTLTDAEVEEVVESVMVALGQHLGAVLR